ncbi:hypothetical protein P879_07830 [Paragonimus westermani]|uniref:Uncharacterized protein n=1 Tax=Paragonimus westermani TaxID=34504 RepID=A0A8T0DKF4_9TREM|nr:hypothetical protein P879_07830 [Paragonimus westermani]
MLLNAWMEQFLPVAGFRYSSFFFPEPWLYRTVKSNQNAQMISRCHVQ